MTPKPAFIGKALALGLLPGPLKAAPSLEYAVKAAYLPKFIPFITWPDGAFAGADAPFTICLLGQDHFEGKLDQAAAGLRWGGDYKGAKDFMHFEVVH